MGEYVDIGGVNTWYDEEGTGEPLVLLHGGLCTNETWAAQMPVFAERFHVVAPERRGHGHTADVPGPLTFADMATDTIGFLDRIVGGPAHLVGWSDGGIVGLLVAIERPDLVRKLVVIGANYDTAGIAPEAEDMAANMAPDSDGHGDVPGPVRDALARRAGALACHLRQVHGDVATRAAHPHRATSVGSRRPLS